MEPQHQVFVIYALILSAEVLKREYSKVRCNEKQQTSIDFCRLLHPTTDEFARYRSRELFKKCRCPASSTKGPLNRKL